MLASARCAPVLLRLLCLALCASCALGSLLVFVTPLVGINPARRDYQLMLNKERSGVNTWLLLRGSMAPVDLRVLGMVDEPGLCDQELVDAGLTCVDAQECVHLFYRVPNVACTMQLAFRLVQEPDAYFLLVNSDIMFTDDLSSTFKAALQALPGGFSMVGRRTDTFLDVPAKFTLDYLRAAQHVARTNGTLHPPMGLDYFIFHRSSFPATFPPFLFGRYRWDNQLASELIVSNVPVVDGTDSILCIHQGVPPNVSGHQITRIGSAYNDRLAKARSGESYLLGSIDNTKYFVEGQCPSCTLQMRPSRLIDNEVIALSRAHPTTRLLIMLTISAGHVDMAMNWACWAHAVGFENFVFLTNDEGVRARMTDLG
jgi:hypothetical protein